MLLDEIASEAKHSDVLSHEEINEIVEDFNAESEDSKVLSQSEIDELVKEIVGIEITERDYCYDDDDDTPMFSDFDVEDVKIETVDANDKALKKYVNRQFKLIELDLDLVLVMFSEIISRGSLFIDLHCISKKKKYFIEYLITRLDWGKEVYRTIKKAEQQNKRRAESISLFINELKTELENAYLNEDGEITFCGETVKAADVIRAIKLFDKYVNKTFIPRICELQKRIDETIDGVKKT